MCGLLGRRATATAGCAPACRPEDAAWNPRHHMIAFAGGYGTDERGTAYGNVEFIWSRS